MNSSSKPILLVEDDPMDMNMAKAALQECDFDNPVVTARDGLEALDYLRHCLADESSDAGPIFVLTDHYMPRMNGLELLAEIRADDRLKRIPVVFMTTGRSGTEIERAYLLGANAYVVKPSKYETFAEAIKTIGRFWASVNKAPRLQ